jgi:twitching motility protein PilT
MSHSIDKILKLARKSSASDIHLIAGIPPAFRVNGEILMSNMDALTREASKELVRQILSDEQWEVFVKEREICVSLMHPEMGRLRVTGYLHAGNPEASLRLCHLEIPTSEELGLPNIIDELTRKTTGLVLITGATGMGKTTTLNYMVDLINRERRCKIVTVEDPIEYVHTPRKSIIVQQEVHTDTRSFAKALRNILRQDPNVIVIGEMRDRETIEIALTAAETGHLVLATLHTSSAEQTLERVEGVFPTDQRNQALMQLGASIQGVVAQLLLPKADKKGRVLATEIMLGSPAIRNLIREGNRKMLTSMIQTSQRQGMRTMDVALLELYQQGIITWDVAASHAREVEQFKTQRSDGARSGKQLKK